MSVKPEEALMQLPQGIPGPKVLSFGPPGSGKTTALKTLLGAGPIDELFILFTEPGMEVLSDTPLDKVHWHYVPHAVVSWATMMQNAKLVTQYDNATLQKMPGMNKEKYQQFYNLLAACNNFKCQRCGKEYGDIAKFGLNRAVALDSLSGLNRILLDHATGGKPIKSQPDWGVAMDNEEQFLGMLCMGLQCTFVLNAHADRETDLVHGGTKVLPAALGSKLPPKVGRFFSDVLFTKRNGTDWQWATAGAGMSDVDTKARNLPWGDKMPQDFKVLMDAWQGKQSKAK